MLYKLLQPVAREVLSILDHMPPHDFALLDSNPKGTSYAFIITKEGISCLSSFIRSYGDNKEALLIPH